ncbi:hypothetical protein, partial [Ralstonia pseudosolanacearum]|uniref:hypothetical protein n=1 Tax=Ralstonia pseudosolanacearum TaxID=1310165 RepID=UPI003221738D
MSERSEFAPFPTRYQKFKGMSPSRARLSFAYFSLARQRKVGQPRQGMKQGLHHKCQALAEA